MKIARGGWSHISVGLGVAAIGVFALVMQMAVAGWLLLLVGALITAFMVYFFRDPERSSAEDPDAVLSGADGWVRAVERMPESRYLNCDTVRISVYLTPWDVHVNRVPMAGQVVGLNYTPGRHVLTRNPVSSEVNEHSTILIKGSQTTCMVRQIVGPLVRRVEYWLEQDQAVARGDRLGIMKFGSRLDLYIPADVCEPLVKPGERVFAGISVVARLKRGAAS